MNAHLQTILELLQRSDKLTPSEKESFVRAVHEAEKNQSLLQFRQERSEKDRRTLSVMLEESIEDLQKKTNLIEESNKALTETLRQLQAAQAQLEHKNQELGVEASLERVRAQAMSMREPGDLLGICRVLYAELRTLGFDELRNAMINIHDDARESFLNYDFSFAAGPTTTTIDYKSHPVTESLVKQIRSAQDAFAEFAVSGPELNAWREYRKQLGEQDDVRLNEVDTLSYYFYSVGTGGIGISTYQPISDEKKDLLKRFRNTFELAYRRYVDITRAEVQAREARIEASLERVRASAMAMHNSEDLATTINTFFQELHTLGVNPRRCGVGLIDAVRRVASVTGITSTEQGSSLPVAGILSLTGHPALEGIYDHWKRQTEYTPVLSGEVLKEYYEVMNPQVHVPEFSADETQFGYYFFFKEGCVYAWTDNPFPEEVLRVFRKFTSVLSLTYRRYQDLIEAEAQAREARIETSLERVRSRTMAMHNSQDVAQTIAALFEELVKLKVRTNRCGILIFSDTPKTEVWTAKSNSSGSASLIIGHLDVSIHPMLLGVRAAWERKDGFFTYEMTGEDLTRYYQAINNFPDYPTRFDLNALPSREVHSDFFFPEGTVFAFTSEPIPLEASQILRRFAGVFGQTYRRYLDLRNAEAQARDAHVEASLERVRSRTMAMQKSDELAEVSQVLNEQLKQLSFKNHVAGFIMDFRESNDLEVWRSDPYQMFLTKIRFPYFDHPLFRAHLEARDKGLEFHTLRLSFEEKNAWLDYSLHYIPSITQESKEALYRGVGYECSAVLLKQVGIFVENFEGVPFSDQENDIIRRFGKVFEQTYTRFNDLKQAEANARDAVRSASLDRVRAKTASMRTAADLERITPMIWDELITLGVPLIRCGVFIMDELQEQIHTFLSTPEGKAIAAFHLPFTATGTLTEVLTHWRRKERYLAHWDEAAFIVWTKSLVDHGAVASSEKYLTEDRPKNLYLHFLPFLQGMLYVGNDAPLSEDQLQLIQMLADAFSTAYARYEDFNSLETAKSQIEKTLVDLKKTQVQLIQSEKMASLGELTAGIAHEIQNPLNFVNNFSEVNSELLGEMQDELKKGNLENVGALVKDIRENEEKINHHGKRADAIVKGMLQHSRSSSGQKELTDINALTEEYLRLAYHGLRAKDKSFNATFYTRFDERLEKIKVIPQDIGRVILNLITNAFYAVSEKKKLQLAAYEPTVTVTTRAVGSDLFISVEDNGNGIPQKVVDKIFQPFFTTKPTGQGTGLGLSLSYDIVKAHGGVVSVETEEGKGSTFTIQLPFNPSKQP